jgi:triosephosphate isomerase (TIM)
MRQLLFAANWKMHIGPQEARRYIKAFRSVYERRQDRVVWFFPPAASLEATAGALHGRTDLLAGAQDIHWESKGAFTGAVSGPIVREAGARATLIGHSERRHLFGETDEETGYKVAAALAADLLPILCVGETLAQRDAGDTLAVVTRQLQAALSERAAGTLDKVTIAYEPVWAIGTGRNATPADAAAVHGDIRRWLTERGARQPRILYGGSVNLKNVVELLAQRELDGVLVGGASLDPAAWAELVRTGAA